MRDYIPDGYGLSKNRMRELYAFCRQYDDWKAKAQPEKCAKIEKAAHEASGCNEVIFGYLLKCVTEGIAYDYMDVPLGRRQFYKLRRQFFWLLDKVV